MSQYNGGYPAALKNAIDHIYKEWKRKPAMIVSYGGHGGGKGAEQLQQVLQFVKMTPIATRPALTFRREFIEANSGTIDAASQFSAHVRDLQKAFTEFASQLGD